MSAPTNDSLGDRMKRNYEGRVRLQLPRRTYTIIRIDGKAFHTYTRGRQKPFDESLSAAMDCAAMALCGAAMGVRFAYGQSDEYSFLLTDFEQITSEAWFDGNLQKICSVAASVFTSMFTYADDTHRKGSLLPSFDCRVFTIPDPIEVENYFIWRQQDAVRNSIQSLGQAHFSPKQLHGVDCAQIQEKLFREKGINWNDTSIHHKRGRCVVKEQSEHEGAPRSRWVCDLHIPTFTEDREYLSNRIPQPETRTPAGVTH